MKYHIQIKAIYGVFTLLVLILSVVASTFSPSIGLAAETAETEKLTIVTSSGKFDFDIEVADEPKERQVGLMHREQMDPKHGMLFVFGATRLVSMWMKNTPLSLDMFFIEENGTIRRIEQRTTPFSESIITSGGPVSHVLELNAGLAALIGAKPGDRVIHQSFSQ